MRTLHLSSHTHWDREWYLTFQQFRLKLVHLIDGLLDILEHDKNYRHFMLDGQTIVLDDYLAIRPEREADLRKYVRNGRLLIGPWYILPDEFLVSPEATIRNLLEGDRTCRKYGPKMMVGYIPDPFGHIGQMPQILRGFGIETACVQRGLADEPCEFWWEAPDGSRVFMAYLRDSYGNAASLPTSDPERFITEVKRLRGRQLVGFKFRRQHPLGPFITDFYCAEKRLVVEIDGDIHDLQKAEDEQRTRQTEHSPTPNTATLLRLRPPYSAREARRFSSFTASPAHRFSARPMRSPPKWTCGSSAWTAPTTASRISSPAAASRTGPAMWRSWLMRWESKNLL